MKTIISVLIVGILISSCAGSANFGGLRSGKLRKVRTENKTEVEFREAANVKEASNYSEIAQVASNENKDYNQNQSYPILSAAEDQALESRASPLEQMFRRASVSITESKEYYSASAPTASSSNAREMFDLNHYLTFWSFILGMLFGALGYLFFSGILYIIAAAFIVTALVLSAFMIFGISKQVTNKDKKYRRRLLLAQILFYSLSILTVLVFVAIGFAL